jgi:hypothetical protein
MNARRRLHLPGFDAASARNILHQIREVGGPGERMNFISSRFLGAPYIVNPLVGSATTPERLTVSLQDFDCVTYIETVLAFALADSVDQFVELIRRIRYKNGEIDWHSRNHYMTDWIRNNVRQGFVTNITRGRDTVSRTRTLGLLTGLPPKTMTFRCLPKRLFHRIKSRIEDGDMIFFASVRKRLDIFHTGLLFWQGERLILRHGSRSQGGVVAQPIEDFLKQNRMAGVILIRPANERECSPTAVGGDLRPFADYLHSP